MLIKKRLPGRPPLDLKGRHFGLLKALKPDGKDPVRGVRWRCQCECGAVCFAYAYALPHRKACSLKCPALPRRPAAAWPPAWLGLAVRLARQLVPERTIAERCGVSRQAVQAALRKAGVPRPPPGRRRVTAVCKPARKTA